MGHPHAPATRMVLHAGLGRADSHTRAHTAWGQVRGAPVERLVRAAGALPCEAVAPAAAAARARAPLALHGQRA
eukprot:6121672-Lingulodinium_polyedra.AAC.1